MTSNQSAEKEPYERLGEIHSCLRRLVTSPEVFMENSQDRMVAVIVTLPKGGSFTAQVVRDLPQSSPSALLLPFTPFAREAAHELSIELFDERSSANVFASETARLLRLMSVAETTGRFIPAGAKASVTKPPISLLDKAEALENLISERGAERSFDERLERSSIEYDEAFASAVSILASNTLSSLEEEWADQVFEAWKSGFFSQ